MKNKIYKELTKVATDSQVTTLEELNIKLKLKLNLKNLATKRKLAKILREISIEEHNNLKPLISVVVIQKNTNISSKDFFNVARELYFHVEDEKTFHSKELSRVHNFWRHKEKRDRKVKRFREQRIEKRKLILDREKIQMKGGLKKNE